MQSATKSAAQELAKEYPLPNEEQLIQELLAIREKRVKPDQSGTFIRESHPKHHGCVRAEFIVEPNLPAELQAGLFAKGQTYPARIRFSNASSLKRDGTFRPDIKHDVRGMAIKLVGVEGEKLLDDEKHETTQDFLLISADALIANDLASFVNLLGEPTPLKLLWFFLNPFNLHIRELGIGIRSVKRHGNPLDVQYFSVVPFLFGDRAVKYQVRPVVEHPDQIPKRPADDFLREAMQQRLRAGDARFDFMVQIQTDPYKMPLEDPSIVWDEELSPYRKVATIHIPAQDFDSPAQLQACENLSFTPWHSLPEHRPLGGLNRARKVVYQALSRLRHQQNNAERREPTANGS